MGRRISTKNGIDSGFDYAYDKRLYDRLREGHPRAVRDHLSAGLDFQDRLARFLENHDEPRAATTFAPDTHKAAAVLTYLVPGLRFFHEGQLEGRRTRISPHLVRAPREPVDRELSAFYERLLAVTRRPEARDGHWRLLASAPAWPGNGTQECLLAWTWDGEDGRRLLVTVNLADHGSQGYVPLPDFGLAGHAVRLQDLLGPAAYDRDRDTLTSQGLYLDLPPWGHHAFEVTFVR